MVSSAISSCPAHPADPRLAINQAKMSATVSNAHHRDDAKPYEKIGMLILC